MGSHVFQHVRCRLNGLLTNLIHADLVPAVFTCRKGAACNVSRRCVHALSLHSIGGCCRGTLGQQPWTLLLPHLSVLPNPAAKGHVTEPELDKKSWFPLALRLAFSPT